MTSLISGLWLIVGSNPDLVLDELNKLFSYNKIVWQNYAIQLMICIIVRLLCATISAIHNHHPVIAFRVTKRLVKIIFIISGFLSSLPINYIV